MSSTRNSTATLISSGDGVKPPLIIIVGPTAVGKSRLSLDLAERLGAEIVSADSRLFYRGMDIGTAKPTEEERRRVPHHLIDVAWPDEIWSLAVFQKAALEAITAIHERGRLPFLVGGTGQYIHAVTHGWIPPKTIPDQKLRSVLEGMVAAGGGERLHHGLATLDPAAAAAIDPQNVRRTIRALEVIFDTGRRFSEQRGRAESPFHLITIGLTCPRPELYTRIDSRIETMFANGLLQEVSGLLERGYSPNLPTMTAIGYRECLQVLAGAMNVEEAKARMRKLTRVFVRRQANWFKLDDPAITWFQMGDKTGPEVETFIRAQLRR